MQYARLDGNFLTHQQGIDAANNRKPALLHNGLYGGSDATEALMRCELPLDPVGLILPGQSVCPENRAGNEY